VSILDQSVSIRGKAWEFFMKAWQILIKRLTSYRIFKSDRSESWDILAKRIKWRKTVKTEGPRFEPRFPTLWVKLCGALLSFVKHWYALGALDQFVTERPKFLNSLKFFGDLAECPALLQGLLRSWRFYQALLRFSTLWCRFACRFKAPSKRHQSAVGVN